MPVMSDLTRLVKDLPDSPGVYLWKDEAGEVIYVGKAKALKKRVSSYLRVRGLDRKTWELMQRARDLETIITSTEREALIVEATLIRKYQPKYNLALKDDRRHAWIRVGVNDTIPSVVVTREFEKDGAKYFGPYGSTRRLERLLDAVRRFIPVATCRDPSSQKRECMDFHIGRCSAPCTGRIDEADYRTLVTQIILFLSGDEDSLATMLRNEMDRAAEQLDFERAAALRDRLDDVQILMRKQRVFDVEGIDRDIIGIARTEEAALVEVLTIRGGILIGSDHFYFEVGLEITDVEVLTTFVEQYYFTLPQLPSEILLPLRIPNLSLLGKWLSENTDRPVKLFVPHGSRLGGLIKMANQNAVRALRKILILGENEAEVVDDGVKELREVLGLSRAPFHIEGFDIANIQGTDPTGSCVVFRNGVPDNKSYRMFRVRSKKTPDDYAMMNEVVYRRYRGVLQRGESLPDLIVIDGGKGQLNSALGALKKLGLDYVPVVSIAKREEILFTRNHLDGIYLDMSSPALHLVQQIRDEAHRFAQKYHHKLRERHLSGSILEDAPGIGPKRRAALLREFGSVEGVKQATIEEIASVEGMSRRAAADLREWLDESSN
ncbi:MAG: excinuclease ABC subunit UvrC [Candidatus Thorarchaeota archaeon]